jgi:hypothetical protein
VIDKNPVVSNCTNKNGCNHWVLHHLINVILLESVKCVVIGQPYKFNSLF